MAFDISHLHLADGSLEAQIVERIMDHDHVPPEEAVRRAIRDAAIHAGCERADETAPRQHKSQVVPLSAEEIDRLKSLDSTFGLLGDVPDEQFDQILAAIREMKREGFPKGV